MKAQNKPVGLYVHIPYCTAKCPYCDFFSVITRDSAGRYEQALLADICKQAEGFTRPLMSVYFGGGTPPLLGADRLCRLLSEIRDRFVLLPDAEISLEANPNSLTFEDLCRLREGGFTRLSIGLQSANEKELQVLSRRHSAGDAAQTAQNARRAGFSELSFDIMLGLPSQTCAEVEKTIAFCRDCGVDHLSAYMLKIEPGTLFFKKPPVLPPEEEVCEQYLCACEAAENAGWKQYEISNFARIGYECRHNLNYWDDGEYLAFGPSAHGFLNGQRYFYPRSIEKYCRHEPVQAEGPGGDFSEYAMLRLRLNEGLTEAGCMERYSFPIPAEIRAAANKLPAGLAIVTPASVSLTRQGFLVSNSVLSAILP